MQNAPFKKILAIIKFWCFAFWILLFISHAVYALSKSQIMRNPDVETRSGKKKIRSKPKLSQERTQRIKGFSIHNDFSCSTQFLNNFDIAKISKQTFIDRKKLNNYKTFSLIIQIIKAHLHIVLKSYQINGIDTNLQKHLIRGHSDDELKAYPKYIATEPAEPMKIYYPDTLRSAVYVKYVMLPLFKEYVSDTHYQALNKKLSLIAFEDVLREEEKRTIWNYTDYKQHITQTYVLLDKIESDFFKKNGVNHKTLEFQANLIIKLLTHNWISFLAVRSCDFVSPPEEITYDINGNYFATAARDNYLLGMGIFEHLKNKLHIYNIDKTGHKKTYNFEHIKKYIQAFETFYTHIEPPHTDKLSYGSIRKIHIDAICSFSDFPIDTCQKIVDKALFNIEN